MKKLVLFLAMMGAGISLVFAWGAWGHQHINRAAVFALPADIRPFFYNHIDFITEEAVVPDLRKYTINDKAEFPRHYIDLELYDSNSNIANLPATMQEARARYPDSFLNKAGILPWYIPEIMEKLTKAMKGKRKTEILFLAADLGHYIGDAHMPLHTAVNHNGQLTGQKGIHALWEGQLPEFFGSGYNLCTGPAKYIDNIVRETWQMVDSTHRLAESVLSIDRELTASLPKEKVYIMDGDGNPVKNKFGDLVHSREYAAKYHELLKGMIERQLRGAIAETAAYWYTAWVNAGKPDLSVLDPAELTERNKSFLRRDLQRWQQGKVDMFDPGGEFTEWAGPAAR
ncbi:MAG TPA: zinc dependent phospholipase C family protein [Puia sp.]|nr:zinc dependent phospholipase C family protein [Puia sp.]